ncbi:MAG: PQQ-dependent sugar dehydrogenase [Pseudobacteriovorax sp.]|nr:PQQ-dependent sugar dehydrogenase [Pseudobacteriovorax sp.]
MAWLPNGDILITERGGQLRIVRSGALDPKPIEGVKPVSKVEADQLFATKQGGLLDVSVHPRFAENSWIYLTYAHGNDDANHTQVARAKFDGQALQDWTVIFKVGQLKSGGQHFGSRMTWLPDETLLISIGDGGNPPVKFQGDYIRKQAQNPGTHLGKILRIHDDGRVPENNPFTNTENAAPEVWSYGHRNVQGIVYDPGSDRVWATEHGARGGDELNLVQKGKNFGWPAVSYSREYISFMPVAEQTSAAGMEDPVRVWTPAIAPSGLAVYRGDRFKEWDGDLFAGGLKSKSVRRLSLGPDGTVASESQIPVGQRVRDVRLGPDGFIYVLTDDDSGRLLRLQPRS